MEEAIREPTDAKDGNGNESKVDRAEERTKNTLEDKQQLDRKENQKSIEG
jgi:hypothetical protein